MKIERKNIFCAPSKILKTISWRINICLKYFTIPTKTLRFPLLCTVPKWNMEKTLVIGKMLLFQLTDFCQMATLVFNTLYKLFSSIFRKNFSRISKKLLSRTFVSSWFEFLILEYFKTSEHVIRYFWVSKSFRCNYFSMLSLPLAYTFASESSKKFFDKCYQGYY